MAVIIFGEVEDPLPLVDFRLEDAVVVDECAQQVGCLGVLLQQRVLEVEGCEGEAGRTLHDWVVGSVNIDFGVDEVSAAELRTTNCDFAIGAVSEENGGFDRADVELGVFASIDGDLGSVVEKNDGAVFEILDHEIDAVDVAWHFDEELVLLRFEHEVGFVEFLFFGNDWNRFWFFFDFRFDFYFFLCFLNFNWNRYSNHI